LNGLTFILGFIGLWSGIWLSGFRGAFFYALLGLLLGRVIDLGHRVRKLEAERDERLKSSIAVSVKQDEVKSGGFKPDKSESGQDKFESDELKADGVQSCPLKSGISEQIIGSPGSLTQDSAGYEHDEERSAVIAEKTPPDQGIRETGNEDQASKQSAVNHETKTSGTEKNASDPVARIIGYIWNFFSTGNVVVKVGIVVLFFGVAFLLKYAAEHSIIPVELRLCGVAAGAIALLVIGWKKRESKRVFGLALQGGGIGILYLTVFSAVRLYDLVPPFPAMCLMIASVVFSAFIAVLQDAKSLAVLASAGGFLAPVLVSTGGGSHVMLFSYYLLLNIGVLSIAWFRSWRELNITGFAFTFVISAMWGIKAYIPENFATTEPFLVFFFLMYVFISVLFAFRQPPDLKGYVDGALVFGLPLVAFGLQCGLVRHFEYGTAISSLALAVFYLCLALWLWKKDHENMRMLTEAFLAASVVFATLAIPFAFDRKWVASSWALEGAAMVWIGLRQKRCLARSFGLFLQICAGLTLFSVSYSSYSDMFILNTRCMNNVIIAVAGLFSGFFYHHYSDRLYRWERGFHGAAALWGVLWWFGAGLSEIDRNITMVKKMHSRLVFMALSSSVFTAVRKPTDWAVMAVPPLVLVPWMFLTAAYGILSGDGHPFAGFGLIAWILSVVAHFYILHSVDDDWKNRIAYIWHTSGFVITILILSWEAAYLAGFAAAGWEDAYLARFDVAGSEAWKLSGWLGVPAAVILLLIRFGGYIEWPAEKFRKAYLSTAPVCLGLFLAACFLRACSYDGNPFPLSYIPVLNPADILQIFVIVTFALWARAIAVERMPEPSFFVFSLKGLVILAGVSFLILLNVILARSVHVWADVNYNMYSMYHSFVFQAAVSILWTLASLFLMSSGSRKGIRKAWFAGAWILAAVVIKLFFVDLGGRGTGERIVSFIVVGILMLVIGFLAPLPPVLKEDGAETGVDSGK
jgi:uncharacterized membrane protein